MFSLLGFLSLFNKVIIELIPHFFLVILEKDKVELDQ